MARPLKPLRVFGENVRDDTGVHQNHAVPRVSRSQLAVSPLTLPPRSSVARTRLPRVSLRALTSSKPSGRSTNSTSWRGSNPCRRRNPGGMVTCPLLVILMDKLLRSRAWEVNPGARVRSADSVERRRSEVRTKTRNAGQSKPNVGLAVGLAPCYVGLDHLNPLRGSGSERTEWAIDGGSRSVSASGGPALRRAPESSQREDCHQIGTRQNN
jgi:hypothetical protein